MNLKKQQIFQKKSCLTIELCKKRELSITKLSTVSTLWSINKISKKNSELKGQGLVKLFDIQIQQIISLYNHQSTNQKHQPKKMSIPSSQQISQALYTTGTLNPKKNKKQNKKNKSSNLEIQNNEPFVCYVSNVANHNNRTNKIEESQKNDHSYSRQTESTSYRNSLDYQRNDFQKNNYKINAINKSNGLKNSILKNQKTNANLLPPQNQRKKPLNVGFVQNQQQNQDNINSRRELAIQGMNLPCTPQKLPISVQENSVSTLDRQRTQRQKYQEELKLIKKKISLANTPLTFKINKGSFLFEKWNSKMILPYRYQKENVTNPKKQNLWNRNSKKSQLRLLTYSLNVDTYLKNKDKRKQGKYPNVNEQQRLELVIIQIKRLMEDGVDFILLQQVSSSSFRKLLLNLLKQFNCNTDDRYLYPKNLQSQEQLVTTMILSKHQVEFGQLQFLIQNPQSQQQIKILSKQAFCIFTVKIGKIQETVCILSSHLKSNEGNNMEYAQKIRKQQIDCIQHFGLKFDRFFCIGDMNIGDSYKFKSENGYVQMKFHDAINYGQLQRRGSFLFMNQRGEIIDEKLDRVWIDKKSALKTQIKVEYIDILLPSFKGLGLSREQLLVRNNGIFEYRTISDHSLMRADITFTQ